MSSVKISETDEDESVSDRGSVDDIKIEEIESDDTSEEGKSKEKLENTDEVLLCQADLLNQNKDPELSESIELMPP